jgi:Transposase, Mutator family
MAIDKEVLDQLLAGRDPQELFAKDGLLDELKKALSERMLSAELDDHLESQGAEDGVNRRNGSSKKTVLTGTSMSLLRLKSPDFIREEASAVFLPAAAPGVTRFFTTVTTLSGFRNTGSRCFGPKCVCACGKSSGRSVPNSVSRSSMASCHRIMSICSSKFPHTLRSASSSRKPKAGHHERSNRSSSTSENAIGDNDSGRAAISALQAETLPTKSSWNISTDTLRQLKCLQPLIVNLPASAGSGSVGSDPKCRRSKREVEITYLTK